MFQNAELTVREYLDMLRRRRWFIAAVAVVIGALGTIPVIFQPSVYASTAQIQLSSEAEASAFDRADENETTRSRELLTAAEVITNREMEALVVERLGPDGPEFDDVFAAVSGFSEIVDITVTAPSAAGAADAANAYAQVYVEARQRAATGALTAQESELRGQVQELEVRKAEIDAAIVDPEIGVFELDSLTQERAQISLQISDYSSRADQLRVDADLRQQASKVVSRAPVETTPIAPKPFRSSMIAIAVGLLVGACFAVFLEILRDRMTDSSELENLDPNLPLLSSVPHVGIDLDVPDQQLPSRALEAFRYLRTAIQLRSQDRPIRSLVVTSATSGEGKTTTAVNLALTIAESGSRVVLVDADMRKASVHTRLGVENNAGLSNVLSGDATLSEVVRFIRPNVAAITAGDATSAATDLLGDHRFIELIRAVQEQCELVIVDAPPILPVADALLAARATNTTVVVGRLGQVRRRELKATLQTLQQARIDVLGLVANDSDMSSRRGGYSTYYEEYGEATPSDA